MTFSIKSILAGVALFSIALVASPQLNAISALYCSLAVGTIAVFILRENRRRCFIYGALGGIVFGLILASTIVGIRFRHLPDVPLPLGRGQFDPNATQRPAVVRDTHESALPYGITMGFVMGGLSGLITGTALTKSRRRITIRCTRSRTCASFLMFRFIVPAQ